MVLIHASLKYTYRARDCARENRGQDNSGYSGFFSFFSLFGYSCPAVLSNYPVRYRYRTSKADIGHTTYDREKRSMGETGKLCNSTH